MSDAKVPFPSAAAELDELTLVRAQRGDRGATRSFVLMYQDRVHALARRLLLRHPHRVDDVAQDVFVKAIQSLPRFDRQGPARLSTWVLTITTRTCIDALRGDRSWASDEATESLGAPEDPEQRTTQRQLGQLVERALRALPLDQRSVLVLRAYHDLDYTEIAAALNIEEGTVKSRLSRARERLRQLVPEAGHG